MRARAWTSSAGGRWRQDSEVQGHPHLQSELEGSLSYDTLFPRMEKEEKRERRGKGERLGRKMEGDGWGEKEGKQRQRYR